MEEQATSNEMSRRRSKWDVPASEVATERGNGSSKSASDAAKERAAKLTAMLAAKGKLANNVGAPLPSMSSAAALSSQKNDKEQDLLYAEVEINDSPTRFILCKGTTQDEINKYSGAAVSTKGRYMDAEEKKKSDKDGERPLHLYIQATSQDKIELALKRIHEIMKGPDIHSKPPTEQASSYTRWSPYQPTLSTANGSFTSNTVPVSQPQNQTLPTGMHYIQDKAFVGLEQASPEFNVKEKLLGPGGSYFQHICTETGAKVFLRGKGSGFLEPTSGREAFEALHIYISHTKQDGLSAARKLVENLIQTVNQEYQNFEQRKRGIPPGYPPHPGYQQLGYMHPYAYPPGMQQPPTGYPLQPVSLPAPHYGQPPPVPPQLPIPAHGPMIPPGYGAPPPLQQAPPYPEPPMPAGPPNARPTLYPPLNVSYPPRPDAPPAGYNGPPQPVPPVPPTPPANEPRPPLPEDKKLGKRDQVAPPPNPQPDSWKRRFKEVPCSEPPQPQQRTSIKESSREPSYLGTTTERKSLPSPQQFQKKDDSHSMSPPPPQSPSEILMPPPKMKQLKSSDQKDFKKPLGLSKPFTPLLASKMVLGKQQSSQKPSNPVLGTKKHGLSSSADSPEPKKTKKEEPKESSLSAIGSLVAYEGDSSEEEEEEEQVPVKSSKQIEARPTSRTKKQQSLPFWAVRN